MINNTTLENDALTYNPMLNDPLNSDTIDLIIIMH